MRDRILVMLSNAQNERLLGETLASRYDVVHAIDGTPFDLCIVAGIVLHREWERLAAIRADTEPVFLPVLLATDRGDVGLITRDLWRVVDDVITRPIEKSELRVRLETLLRARRLSLDLRELSDAYEHERRIARRLQAAGLPSAFPEVPGLTFDAFYRAGSDEAIIGGDWYDAMRLADGRVVLTVGDVSGAGLEAAVTMHNVRQALRGVAQVHPDPGLMLDAADRALVLEANEQHVTAFVGVFDCITGFLVYASAGHPPAMLRLADGTLHELTTSGLPLGVSDPAARLAESVAIPGGATLVLYTDGLTEARHDVIAGQNALRDVVAGTQLARANRPALAVYDGVLEEAALDDVAILVMRTSDAPPSSESLRRWTFDSSDAHVARSVREEIVDLLEQRGFSSGAIFAVELVYGELIGNVVRYAPGKLDVVLDTSARSPVLHVLDHGAGFRMTPRLPYDDMSERGRGLFIINELVDQFHVLRRSSGGSHASAVLRR